MLLKNMNFAVFAVTVFLLLFLAKFNEKPTDFEKFKPINDLLLSPRSPVEILVVVISDPKNGNRRNEIRETWGHHKVMEQCNATMIFFIGRTDTGRPPYLREEATNNGDLVFREFLEDYFNLSIKTMEALKWATYEFKYYDYFIKVDDDVIFKVEELVSRISEVGGKFKEKNSRFIFGHLLENIVPKRENSKWQISVEEYSPDSFPSYCSGTCYVLTRSAVNAIVDVCKNKKLIHLEDVAITGICGDLAHVDKHMVHGFIITQYFGNLCDIKNAVSHHLDRSPEDLKKIYGYIESTC